MTDRRVTLVPPPQVDRDRKTDPPLPTDKAPPEDLLGFAETVGARFNSIDGVLAESAVKIDALYEVMMGVVMPNGHRSGGIVDAIEDIRSYVATVAANSELILEKHREYVNEVARVHQENVALKFDVRDLQTRLDKFDSQHPGPNGSTHSDE